MNFCPLCGEPILDERSAEIEYLKTSQQQPDEELLIAYQKLSGSQKRKLFWEISGIILFSGIMATLVIDLLGDGHISWSRYPVAVCAALFMMISLFCFWPKMLLLGSFATISGLMVLLDVFKGDIDWGIKLAIPLLLTTGIMALALVWIIKKTKEKGFNLIAYSFIASGLLCMGIESIISLYTDNVLKLHWSLVVITSVLPISAVLFFFHYRLKKGTDLKRFFHI